MTQHDPAPPGGLLDEIDDEVWTPTAQSVAARAIHLGRMDGSVKATLVADGRRIVAESSLEEKIALVLLADPSVVALEEQIAPVDIVDLEGKHTRRWFDFRVTLDDGFRIAVTVKYAQDAVKQRLEEELRHIAPRLPRDFADGVKLMTERDASRDVVHDARLIHAARRDPPSGADARIRELLRSLSGFATVSEIVGVAGGGAEAFRALARLLGTGEIALQAPRLDYRSLVSRGPRFT